MWLISCVHVGDTCTLCVTLGSKGHMISLESAANHSLGAPRGCRGTWIPTILRQWRISQWDLRDAPTDILHPADWCRTIICSLHNKKQKAFTGQYLTVKTWTRENSLTDDVIYLKPLWHCAISIYFQVPAVIKACSWCDEDDSSYYYCIVNNNVYTVLLYTAWLNDSSVEVSLNRFNLCLLHHKLACKNFNIDAEILLYSTVRSKLHI